MLSCARTRQVRSQQRRPKFTFTSNSAGTVACAEVRTNENVTQMKPSDFAVEELALWERALQEQRAAEERLMAARATLTGPALMELLEQVHELRTNADLLLANAARAKAQYRERRDAFAELAGPDDCTPQGEGAWLWPRQPPSGSD
jgi:hypothetical protein